MISRSLAAALLALAPLATASTPTPAPVVADDLDIDFAALGKKVLDRAGLGDRDPSEVMMEEILEASFITIRLGLFDLGMSTHSTADKMRANDLVDLADALLDAQAAFLEWCGPKAPGKRDAEKDIKTLKKWLEGVRGADIAALDKSETGELSSLLRTRKNVLEAQARFGEYMSRGVPLGLEREGELVEPFIVAPTRRDFLEHLSVFGLLLPDQQPAFWTNDAKNWTNTYFNDIKLVALEFADIGSSTAGAFGGISMNSRTPTGMEQQITQLAGNSMLDNLFGDKIPPSLAGALSVNLVIDVYGECNTRIDGDLRSRRTQAREIFVPGGLSEGGILPPNMADSRWRTEQGSDRFLNTLQAAQNAGRSEATTPAEREICFEIHSDSGGSRMTLKAPFLGSIAAAKNLKVPDKYYGDSLEFFRSYRSGFVHWLQTQAAGSKKNSEKAFAEFLNVLAQRGNEDGALEGAIEEIYGDPLTSELPSKKGDLEGKFLTWLSKL